jgi:pyruvate/2-oxoglutarate dehydrogenase complex dihydrolipoamide dehydrogenase (E3) component
VQSTLTALKDRPYEWAVSPRKRSSAKVDKYLRTSVPDLYAAGDVTGQVMLVSGATHEGHVAAVNAVTDADTKKAAHERVPRGSFTDPEYGAIGMRERELAGLYLCTLTMTRWRRCDKSGASRNRIVGHGGHGRPEDAQRTRRAKD